MSIKRESLVNALQFAKFGLSEKGESIEQANAFVFTEDSLVTFNDEILTKSKSPLPIKVAIVAADFLKLLEKIPDEEIEVSMKGEEVRIKGAKREAGVTAFKEILLPFSSVPSPGEWSKVKDGVMTNLMQAARTCGSDVSNELTTMVHVTPDLIEGCDNFRLFRATLKTGFPAEVLIPKATVLKLDGLGVEAVSVGEGWAHFKTDSGVLSVRCSHQKYMEGLDNILKIGDAEKLSLPNNLGEILSRAEVMLDKADPEAKVVIRIEPGKLFTTSRKDGGWYKEEKRIKYDGPEIEFLAHPKFLVDMLERTRDVLISGGTRMKMEADGVEFMVALTVPEASE